MGLEAADGIEDQPNHESLRKDILKLDYMFMDSTADKDVRQDVPGASTLPLLVMADHVTSMTLSSVVPPKGVHAYSVVRMSNDLSLLGHSSLVLKSDNEASLNALKEAARA